jgi:hypothetical protein
MGTKSYATLCCTMDNGACVVEYADMSQLALPVVPEHHGSSKSMSPSLHYGHAEYADVSAAPQ